ncbi:MAG TPA: radical SAM protein [Longimicrobium sp.]|nr:radical SAM protein [Longimicrobium sp.]
MLLGFAITEHCNLRCPHCIRDDVTTVRNLDPDLILRTVDQARVLFGDVSVSMTGGEPTLHPQWERIIAGLHERGVAYGFVTNGWHMRRLMPALDRYPPAGVKLSLSGADEAVHDAERGRGSFRRVLMAMALLTSRQIPASLGMVVDRRDRHQLREAADLAEALGCVGLHFALAQPVPGSAARDSDLAPHEWYGARDEIFALAREGRRTFVTVDYGTPSVGPVEMVCDTFEQRRVYVDARGRLSLCCQLSEYGENETDVVADLNHTTLHEAWPLYTARLAALQCASQELRDQGGETAAFPCIRCARALGKMEWVREYPGSPWHAAAGPIPTAPPPRLVGLSYRGRTLRPA